MKLSKAVAAFGLVSACADTDSTSSNQLNYGDATNCQTSCDRYGADWVRIVCPTEEISAQLLGMITSPPMHFGESNTSFKTAIDNGIAAAGRKVLSNSLGPGWSWDTYKNLETYWACPNEATTIDAATCILAYAEQTVGYHSDNGNSPMESSIYVVGKFSPEYSDVLSFPEKAEDMAITKANPYLENRLVYKSTGGKIESVMISDSPRDRAFSSRDFLDVSSPLAQAALDGETSWEDYVVTLILGTVAWSESYSSNGNIDLWYGSVSKASDVCASK